jgi:enterochelin esterase-like enzyme
LTAIDVPHEWNVFDGAHEEAYWSAHIVEYLEWYSQPWKDMSQTTLAQ